MRRIFPHAALGLAVVVGCAAAFLAAFTVVGEMGIALVIVALAALFTRRRPTSEDRRRASGRDS